MNPPCLFFGGAPLVHNARVLATARELHASGVMSLLLYRRGGVFRLFEWRASMLLPRVLPNGMATPAFFFRTGGFPPSKLPDDFVLVAGDAELRAMLSGK